MRVKESTCPPTPPLSLSFVMLMQVRPSISATICPSSEAPLSLGPKRSRRCSIVCVCPSRKWTVDMLFVASESSSISSTSLLFGNLHVTMRGGRGAGWCWWGRETGGGVSLCRLCAAILGSSTVSSAARTVFMCDVSDE